jgi:2-hydroxycyclohexanecarboxyl-CoA dehydrogenase
VTAREFGNSSALVVGGTSGIGLETTRSLVATRVPRIADVAELAVFLPGPGSRRIIGQAISVNGGISAA